MQNTRAQGESIISVRWCDINEGDDQQMLARSRVVGRGFKPRDPNMQGACAPAAVVGTLTMTIALGSDPSTQKERAQVAPQVG